MLFFTFAQKIFIALTINFQRIKSDDRSLNIKQINSQIVQHFDLKILESKKDINYFEFRALGSLNQRVTLNLIDKHINVYHNNRDKRL